MAKKLFVLLLIVFLNGTPVFADVEINEANFPDEAFRNFVSHNFDRNNDGLLSDEERYATPANTLFRFTNNSEMTSMKGIEYLRNVTMIDLGGTSITELDLRGCQDIKKIDIYQTPLVSLKISGLEKLTYLSLHHTELTELDLSGCTALEDIDLQNNTINTLDVSRCTELKTLECPGGWTDGSQLTQLNVKGLSKLETLKCGFNQLTELNCEGLSSLKYLYCGDNSITSLNLSGSPLLEELSCYNNKLRSLNVSGLTKLESLYCGTNQLAGLDLSTNTALKTLGFEKQELDEVEIVSSGNSYQLDIVPYVPDVSCIVSGTAEVSIAGSSQGFVRRFSEDGKLTFTMPFAEHKPASIEYRYSTESPLEYSVLGYIQNTMKVKMNLKVVEGTVQTPSPSAPSDNGSNTESGTDTTPGNEDTPAVENEDNGTINNDDYDDAQETNEQDGTDNSGSSSSGSSGSSGCNSGFSVIMCVLPFMFRKR